MLIPDSLMPHGGLVSYKALEGSNSLGPVDGEPVTPERAKITDKRSIVRNAAGEEETSSARVYLDPEHEIPLESLVTIWVGTSRERESRVIATSFSSHDDSLPTFFRVWLE